MVFSNRKNTYNSSLDCSIFPQKHQKRLANADVNEIVAVPMNISLSLSLSLSLSPPLTLALNSSRDLPELKL